MSEERREINLLDEATIDKIAAGEVVERPASIVKELVENSIDAGAKDITIEIRDGGLTLVRVTDNGSGIPAEQVPKAFLRHSTSKITDADDLRSVRSLGFRGEALSSISAVSKVEILTKTKDAFVGTSYRIEGGREIENIGMGTPDGTTIFVRALFYNTPARRKFLKSPMTEGNTVSNIVERLALSHPDVSFRFLSGGRQQLLTPGNGNPMDVIYEIYGRETVKGLLEIDVDAGAFRVRGWIGKPAVGRGNRAAENFFVNGRYVRSKVISKALEEGYRGFLMQHRFPLAVLFLDFSADTVDVNVHPTKQEVRFYDESAVYECVKEAVSERLRQREDIESAFADSDGAKSVSDQAAVGGAEPFESGRLAKIKEEIAEKISVDSPYGRMYPQREVSSRAAASSQAKWAAEEQTGEERVEGEQQDEITSGAEVGGAVADGRTEPVRPVRVGPVIEEISGQSTFLSEEAVKQHRIIGQVFSVYWLVEFDGSLYIIDQHAAHEKVLYERFMNQIRMNDMTSQQLSPPVIISLNRMEQDAVRVNQEALSETGFSIEAFGGNEYAVTAVPGNIVDVDVKQLLMTIVADLASGKKEADLTLVKERIATMSCKAAVKENDVLSLAEADALIGELLGLEEPYHCPHGRPTIISMKKAELDKRFRRIV